VLKIWGRAKSINVQKVLWMCEELRIPYERIDAGGAFGWTREEYYLARNPTGMVLMIENDEIALWESNSIARYLASCHPEAVICPADPVLRARPGAWMDWQLGTLWPPVRTLFQQLIRTAARERSRAVMDRAQSEAAFYLTVLEKARISPVGTVVYRWYALDRVRPSYPAIAEWYKRLTERPAFARTVMKYLC
jgi:glutathione S-transferase